MERTTTTASLLTFTGPDVYGQLHPVETPALLATALREFQTCVAALPAAEAVALRRAEATCPELLTDDFRLLFLRCELFGVERAVARYAYYWRKRLEVFGPTKAFEPLTQAGALRDDGVALRGCLMAPTGRKEPTMGRSLLFGDPARLDLTLYTRESMVRATWYVFHCALEDTDTQRHGVVLLLCPRHVHLRQLDRRLMQLNSDCIKGAIPARLAAFHVCHPPTFFAIIWQFLKVFLGKLRRRVRIHAGEHVMDSLGTFGLTADLVPTDIGGNVVVDVPGWLEVRRAMEG